ncbi:hypothetical protein NG701_16635 [Pseudarthrobacter sp. HLT3-5]|uniref:hypothetical protein n=1 Tax=Pseudarthrobacter cellobiosi TaxID=2953654 RepID=UPI00208F0170|nr:hypothetical protein [Pseudarthrobacter sp. HLT3-5]MCO4276029.1 hypothetical protein [Pseudarthrobacter sp. HLT3-5]
MQILEAGILINARSSTVWDVITDASSYTVWDSGITDASSYTVWDSGITEIDGDVRNGGTIRIRTTTSGNRRYRLRVEQIPGEVMTWTGGLPLGPVQSVRTFTISSLPGRDDAPARAGRIRRPSGRAHGKNRLGHGTILRRHIRAVKERAELFG